MESMKWNSSRILRHEETYHTPEKRTEKNKLEPMLLVEMLRFWFDQFQFHAYSHQYMFNGYSSDGYSPPIRIRNCMDESHSTGEKGDGKDVS